MAKGKSTQPSNSDADTQSVKLTVSNCPSPARLPASSSRIDVSKLISQQRHILVLDLDETIGCYNRESKKFTMRPLLRNFLRNTSKNWEVCIFTASIKEYADTILNDIDVNGYISRRFYRNHCTIIEGIPIKDLRTVNENVDLKKVVIVDDTPQNFSLQFENGIQIKPFLGTDQSDKELMKLERILIGLQQMDDVRVGIANI